MDKFNLTATTTHLPRHPSLMIAETVLGEPGYIILLPRGHTFVGVKTGLLILKDCLESIRRHTTDEDHAAHGDAR